MFDSYFLDMMYVEPRSQGLFWIWGREKALAPAGIFCNFIGQLFYTVNLFKKV